MTRWRQLAVFEIDLGTGGLRLRHDGKNLDLLREVLSGGRDCKIEPIGIERRRIYRMGLRRAIK